MHPSHQIKFFSGRKTLYLARKIAKSFGTKLGKSSVTKFKDGEFQPSYDESVRGSTVFIIQSTFPPTDNLFELLLMIDAAKRASAYKIVAVIPYFGWARQDRKDKPRVSIGARMVADMLSASGVDRVMTMDLHADQIQGFFSVPVDHIYASTEFFPYIQGLKLENLAVAAPDMGGAKRANAYSRILNCPMIICYKSREKANEVSQMTAIGDIKGKNIIILDDMIDTGGTITKAADMMKEKGALSVRAIATHPILSGQAYDNIARSALSEVIVTDTVPLRKGVDTSKIKVISIANLFADVINKVYNYESISSKFIM
ncbi:MAG: ribose-phosphate pyrophosphokinase [Prevotellaceae bacterium]|jgi:ribose-phosphate pyrophosphokinase|nr:ribose-phosphate pyrophosphokinase [Prevotellaceae bacterium]